METLAIFHISLEIWGVLVCIIASGVMIAARNQLKNRFNIAISMQILCILLLISDALAWYSRGRQGDVSYYMVRYSNFCVFFINFIYMSLFSVYLWNNLRRNGDKKPKRVYAVFGLSVLGVAMLIISQFNDMLYYFKDNLYHRGRIYIVTQVIAMIGIIINMSLLFEYKKRLEKPVFWSMMLYFILPFIATIVMIFHYGLSLQNIAIVASTQIMFIVDIADMSRRLRESQLAYIEASHEAKHDAVTGLFNKKYGTDKMIKYIESMSENDKASLVFIDIDDFKKVNDTYGHMSGDFWIERVAENLRKVCKNSDILCRFGGDEYVVLLENVADYETINTVTGRFSELMSEDSENKGQFVHCSIGVCMINGAGNQYLTCVKCANEALYEAKAQGKHKCVIKTI